MEKPTAPPMREEWKGVDVLPVLALVALLLLMFVVALKGVCG